MKYKILHIRLLFMLLIAASVMCSCTDTLIRVIDDYQSVDEMEMVPVVLDLQGLFGPENSPSTYSLTDIGDAAGLGAENQINDVTVFIFNSVSGACERILYVVNLASLKTDTVLVQSGNKTLVAVANKANFVSPPLPGVGQESTVIYNSLKEMMTSAVLQLPKAPFLMTGEKSEFIQINKTLTNPNRVTIEVKRAVAKVKIFVNKSGLANNHALYLHEVTFNQGADRAAVLVKNASSPVNYTLDSTATVFNPVYSTPGGNIPQQSSGQWCQVIDTFYTYESLCAADKSKAVYFDFEVGVSSPTNFRHARVYLADNPRAPGDTIYDIHRNYWYNVYVTITDPGLDSVYLNVKACPWNVADTQKIVVGTGYEAVTASPFRLVKNYNYEEVNGYPGYPRIRKHSKGGSWIKLTISPNTDWELSFTSGTDNNYGAVMDKGYTVNWTLFPYTLSGTTGAGGLTDTFFIYRPYMENAEPNKGPTVVLKLAPVGDTLTTVREFQVGPRDTVPFPTNCYIMRPQLTGAPVNETRAYIPLAGVYRVWEDYILRNGDTIPAGNITAALLWQDRTGNVIKPGSLTVINPSKRDSAYLYVEAGTVQGNAVIAMQVNGITYWSFHLWVTEYDPYQAAGQKYWQTKAGNKDSANVFMDRNLGALVNYYEPDGEVRGLFYQWGRKDPFPRGKQWTNTFSWYSTPGGAEQTSITTSTTTSMSSSSLRALVAVPYALQHPMDFLTLNGSNEYPLSAEPNSYGLRLWNTQGGNKTAYDPCPEGWRVPKLQITNFGTYNQTYSPWWGLQTGGTALFVDSASIKGRYNASIGYYPYSGWIDNTGTLLATKTYYGTSFHVSGSNTIKQGQMDITINPPSVYLDTNIPSNAGMVIRCVVDRNYLRDKQGGKFVQGNYLQLKNELLP